MAKARIPFAGSMVGRDSLSSVGRDQYFQNCYSYAISDQMTGGSRIYTEKRRGWTSATVADAIRPNVGGCVWQSAATPKLALPFVMGTPEAGETPESITGVSVFDQAGSIIGANITTVVSCNGISDTTISGTGNLIASFNAVSTGLVEGWYFPEGGSWTKITDGDFPPNQGTPIPLARHTPVSMDGYTFWMTTNGRIYNSDLNSVSSYTSTGFITSDVYPDGGVAVARSGRYIVAMGTYSIQFFVNNGNPTGSPLSAIPGAAVRIGVGTGPASYMAIGDSIYFAGINTESGQRGVYRINGQEIKKVSTPEIDNFLFSAGATAYCLGAMKFAGYEHVMFHHTNGGATYGWMYSAANNRWWYFTASSSAQYVWCGLSLGDTKTYISSRYDTTASILKIDSSASVYTDGTPSGAGTLAFTIQTMPIDLGTDNYKTCSKLKLIGDKQASTCNVAVSWSDDDAVTFSTPVNIDMSSSTNFITRLGRFKRRVFKFTNATNLPLRLEAFELEYEVGTA